MISKYNTINTGASTIKTDADGIAAKMKEFAASQQYDLSDASIPVAATEGEKSHAELEFERDENERKVVLDVVQTNVGKFVIAPLQEVLVDFFE